MDLNWFIEWHIFVIIFSAVIGTLWMFKKSIRSHFQSWQMRNNPKYIAKHKNKYFTINPNQIILFSGLNTFPNRQWIVDIESLLMKPDEKHEKGKLPQYIPLSNLQKIEIKPTKNMYTGRYFFLRLWHKDFDGDTPLEHRLPNYSLPFMPIGLEAAEEIVRRVNEQISQK